MSTRVCLDLPGGDTTNGALLWLWDCYGGETQKWALQNGQLVYAADTTKCVDLLGNDETNGNQLGLWDCNGGESQKWFVERWDLNRLKLGTKATSSGPFSTNPDRCAAFPYPNSWKGGDPVVIWDCGDPGLDVLQSWELVYPESEFVLPSSDFPTPINLPNVEPSNLCIGRWSDEAGIGFSDCWADGSHSISVNFLWHWVGNQFVSVMDGQCLGVQDNWELSALGYDGQIIDRDCSEDLTTWAFDADSHAIQLASNKTKCLGSTFSAPNVPPFGHIRVGLFDCDGSDLQLWRFRAPGISLTDVIV